MSDEPPAETTPPAGDSSPPPGSAPTTSPPKKAVGVPKAPFDQVVAKVREAWIADPGISKGRLSAIAFGVSHGTIDKAMVEVEAELRASGKWDEKKHRPVAAPSAAPDAAQGGRAAAETTTTPPADPAKSPETSPATTTAPADNGAKPAPLGSKDNPLHSVLDLAGEAALDEVLDRIRSLPKELQERVVGRAEKIYAGLSKQLGQAVAQAEVDRKARDEIAHEATRNTSWHLTAGRAIRKWYDRIGPGLEFDSPAELVEAALQFMFDNRDELPRLRREIGMRDLALSDLALELDPYVRREQAVSKVMTWVSLLLAEDRPIPNNTVAMFLAEASSVGASRPTTLEEVLAAAQVEV